MHLNGAYLYFMFQLNYTLPEHTCIATYFEIFEKYLFSVFCNHNPVGRLSILEADLEVWADRIQMRSQWRSRTNPADFPLEEKKDIGHQH